MLTVRRARLRFSAVFEEIGRQMEFYLRIMAGVITLQPLRRGYTKQIATLISDITIGAGALIVGGGMVFVIFSMSFFTGTEVGLQGFKGLEQIGAEAFTGLIGSFANTREVTPLIAGVAFAAQVGAGFTAELGAMRISDEIDALEVMSVPSFVYLVCTRVMAAIICIIPLYLFSLFASFFATKLVTTKFFGLSPGHLRPLLPALPAADRRLLQPGQGGHLRRRRVAHPLLLRLLRDRRSGRRRRGRRPGHPAQHRERGRAQPRAVDHLLGRRQHRESGGRLKLRTMSDRTFRVLSGLIAILLASSVLVAGTKISSGAIKPVYHVSGTFTTAGQGLLSGNDVKIHGVNIGKVSTIKLVDGKALIRLTINKSELIPVNAGRHPPQDAVR